MKTYFHAISCSWCAHCMKICSTLAALRAGTMTLLADYTSLWHTKGSAINKHKTFQSLPPALLSYKTMPIYQRQAHKRFWNWSTQIKQLSTKSLATPVYLQKWIGWNSKDSNSRFHFLMIWETNFRSEPSTCDMHPQRLNICWLQSTP